MTGAEWAEGFLDKYSVGPYAEAYPVLVAKLQVLVREAVNEAWWGNYPDGENGDGMESSTLRAAIVQRLIGGEILP